jgi:hypothetical protein
VVLLVLYNLPFQDRRRLVLSEINLVLEVVHCVYDRFDDGIHDFPAVHADADFVADFGLFGRHQASLAEWRVWATARDISKAYCYWHCFFGLVAAGSASISSPIGQLVLLICRFVAAVRAI